MHIFYRNIYICTVYDYIKYLFSLQAIFHQTATEYNGVSLRNTTFESRTRIIGNNGKTFGNSLRRLKEENASFAPFLSELLFRYREKDVKVPIKSNKDYCLLNSQSGVGVGVVTVVRVYVANTFSSSGPAYITTHDRNLLRKSHKILAILEATQEREKFALHFFKTTTSGSNVEN